MQIPSVKLIYASTPQGVIGDQGSIPWHIPEDLQLFKEKTLHQSVMMGRKTFESLPASFKPLPHRKNIVVSRNKALKIPGVTVVHDPLAYIYSCKETIWVMGGGELYAQVQHLCDELHHTEVHAQLCGDTRFHMDTEGWDLASDSGDLRSRTGIAYRVRSWSIPLLLARF